MEVETLVALIGVSFLLTGLLSGHTGWKMKVHPVVISTNGGLQGTQPNSYWTNNYPSGVQKNIVQLLKAALRHSGRPVTTVHIVPKNPDRLHYLIGFQLFDKRKAPSSTSLALVAPDGTIVAHKIFNCRIWQINFVNSTTVYFLTTNFDSSGDYSHYGKFVLYNFVTDVTLENELKGATHNLEYNHKRNSLLWIHQTVRECDQLSRCPVPSTTSGQIIAEHLMEHTVDTAGKPLGSATFDMDLLEEWVQKHDTNMTASSNNALPPVQTCEFTHGNYVVRNPDDQSIYFNPRYLDTLFNIDHQTKKIRWAAGKYSKWPVYYTIDSTLTIAEALLLFKDTTVGECVYLAKEYTNHQQLPLRGTAILQNILHFKQLRHKTAQALLMGAHSINPLGNNTFVMFDNGFTKEHSQQMNVSRLIMFQVDEIEHVVNVLWYWRAPKRLYRRFGGGCHVIPTPTGTWKIMAVFGRVRHHWFAQVEVNAPTMENAHRFMGKPMEKPQLVFSTTGHEVQEFAAFYPTPVVQITTTTATSLTVFAINAFRTYTYDPAVIILRVFCSARPKLERKHSITLKPFWQHNFVQLSIPDTGSVSVQLINEDGLQSDMVTAHQSRPC